MNLDGFYPLLKGLHVASVLVFVGGLLVVSVFLNAVNGNEKSSLGIAQKIRNWDQKVTTPAMFLTWALGIVLAISGSWFSDLWLQIKFILVLILSGLHGVQSGNLRRLSSGTVIQPKQFAPYILLIIVGIAILAVVKPV